jgi:cytochrome P450
MCLAKQLAETEMFLFFATLLQRFRFENAQPDIPLDMEGRNPGVTYIPNPYKVLLLEN